MLDVGKRLFASEMGGCNAANHSSASESEHTPAVGHRLFRIAVSHSTLLLAHSSGRLGLRSMRLNRSWDWGHVCKRTWLSSTATLVSLNVKSSSSGCNAWTARGSSSIGAIGEMRMNTPASFATGRPLLFDYHLRPNPTDNTTLA